ncbi:hypothetical protein VNO78_12497 [Psophocarpus tetragonolobus]|uniref:SMARCC C-terminal domain-containing protein n=1 Tax=Psophocarpus tetragonolobus TaxID=3891 RepID=A0AAN9SQ14_PSOTE
MLTLLLKEQVYLVHVLKILLSTKKGKDDAKVGLSTATTKVNLFADHEKSEIQRLFANILKRLKLKLKQLAEVETHLMRECEPVEKGRLQVVSTRLANGGTTSMNVASVTVESQVAMPQSRCQKQSAALPVPLPLYLIQDNVRQVLDDA